MSDRTFQLLNFATVACLVLSAVLNCGPLLGLDGNATTIPTLLAILLFTILHGGLALGWKHLAVFVGLTFGVSFTAEAVGVATGLVFGNYHYTDLLGPKILGVPPMVQVGYIAMSYASLMICRIVLGACDALATPRGWGVVAVAVGGAYIMVSWDVAMDPYQSTIFGDWIWHDGGPYFGIPLHNYAGWFGTVFTFLLLYLVYEQAHPLPAPGGRAARRGFLVQPVLNYAIMALGIVFTPLIGGLPDAMASPQNYSGTLHSIELSMSLVAIFVMGSPVLLALGRLFVRR